MALSFVLRSKSAEKQLFRIDLFETGFGPRFAPKITDSSSDFLRASTSSLRPGWAGLTAVGGGGFMRRRAALEKGRPEETFPIPVATAERGSIPFSTTASRTVNMTITIPTMFFISSEVSGFSKIGLMLLTRAVAVTRTSFIAVGSRDGLGGGC